MNEWARCPHDQVFLKVQDLGLQVHRRHEGAIGNAEVVDGSGAVLKSGTFKVE